MPEARQPTRALLVEDDPNIVDLIRSNLSVRGFETLVSADPDRALRLLETEAPDIVLLDLMLPDISGFDVCRRLRTDRATMLTPVVMLTALRGLENLTQGFRVGANAYVTKPYGVDELLEAISAARSWRAEMDRHNLHGEIHVELNSEIVLLNDLNDFLLHLCQSTPFQPEQVMQLRQAVMEMAHNAIEWGNKHQTDRLVNIRYRVFPDRIEIVVRDQGPGFDREALPHAAAPDDPFSHLDVRDKLGLRAGGFGLMICKGMVDDLHYNDVGNEVTLIKRFRGGEPS